jgi:hypothetical protein
VAEIDADAPENQHPQPAHEVCAGCAPLLLPASRRLEAGGTLPSKHRFSALLWHFCSLCLQHALAAPTR